MILIIEGLGAVLGYVTQLDRTYTMNPPDFDLSQDRYIADMWAYAKSSAHTAQGVGSNLFSIEAKLQAALDCSDDWLSAWSQTAALSLGETRDCLAAVVRELEHLARVYQDLLPKPSSCTLATQPRY